MFAKLAGGIVFIMLGIILLTQPWQLFVRNGPETVKIVKTKPFYRKYLKISGLILLSTGALIELSMFI